MSERVLAHFLHGLLAHEHRQNGALVPSGAVTDPQVLRRLVEQPASVFHTLLSAHLDALLAPWPGGASLRLSEIDAAPLWVGAALNNLAWAATQPSPSPRLVTMTQRLVQQVPPATTRAAMLAYHSMLRHIVRLPLPPTDWDAVIAELVRRSPLTAVWLPRVDGREPWPQLLALLNEPPVQAGMRDRWLGLLPTPDELVQHGITTAQARTSAEVGRVLEYVREHGGEAGQHVVLTFYEAECLLHRHGSEEQPVWPLLRWIHTTRGSSDPLVRRTARRVLARYRPLWPLLMQDAVLRRYRYLDGRFGAALGELLLTDQGVWLKC